MFLTFVKKIQIAAHKRFYFFFFFGQEEVRTDLSPENNVIKKHKSMYLKNKLLT